MECFINKEKVVYSRERSLWNILKDYDYHDKKGVAIAVNDEVIPKNQWGHKLISQNDRITIIQATQGG